MNTNQKQALKRLAFVSVGILLFIAVMQWGLHNSPRVTLWVFGVLCLLVLGLPQLLLKNLGRPFGPLDCDDSDDARISADHQHNVQL